MTHNHPRTEGMTALQLRLRDARKICADDGFNRKFCAVFDDAIRDLSRLQQQCDELRADAARLDWLADPENEIANVQLPAHCVTANLDSLRGAIDMSMREQAPITAAPKVQGGEA